MRKVRVEREMQAPRKAVWDVLADFPNIADWNGGVKKSFATGELTEGVGASRHCDLAPMGGLEETVRGWQPEELLVISIDEASTLPIKQGEVTFDLRDEDAGTVVTVSYDYETKYGVLGRLMGRLDKQLTSGFVGFLADLAGVTRGESVTFLKRYDDNIVQPAIAALPTIYTARVASAGTLVHGTSGVTSAKTSTGSYTVDFPADVVDCTWGATPTAAGGFLFVIDTTEIFATVSSAAASFLPPVSDPDTVIVNIFDEDGASQDWRFDLTIVC